MTKAWVRSLVRHQLSFVPHFFRGLTANPERLDFDIKTKDMARLEACREKAMAAGHLISSLDDWVNAQIRYRGETYAAQVRLKGDMPDHWTANDGWSLKVKLKDDKTILGMNRFAVQHPWTRWFLTEWVTYRWLEAHDLITMRYQFAEVWINGKNQSVFSVEENFDKNLIENNRLREGVILRLNNDLSWAMGNTPLPSYQNFLDGDIEPGYAEKLISDPNQMEIYKKAATLLEQLRMGQLTVEQVIDVETMSRFFALFELFKSEHIISLDNMRLYYNPITSRIEPVGYDCEDLGNFKNLAADELCGFYPAGQSNPISLAWLRTLFGSRAFYEGYLRTLEEISQPGYLEGFFARIDAQQQAALDMLYKSYPWYYYEDKAQLSANRDHIRTVLDLPHGPVCYVKQYDARGGILHVQARNLHVLPVVLDRILIGQKEIVPSDEVLLYSRHHGEPVSYIDIALPVPQGMVLTPEELAGTVTVDWQVMGLQTVRQSPVKDWPAITDEYAAANAGDVMRTVSTLDQFVSMLQVSGKTVTIVPGRHEITRPLIVPGGYRLVCGAGTELDLRNGGMILSRSPVELAGTEVAPVRIVSSDHTGFGLVVMQAGGVSRLEWVECEGLSNPTDNGWSVTAALLFYESELEMRHCTLAANRCEDYLNVVRGRFLIENTVFQSTAADAFDSDFGQGLMKNVHFIHCGNDAVDVSGTVIDIENMTAEQIGDKAISAGEGSQMTVRQANLNGGEIAVASKDRSELRIQDVSIEGFKVGFTAYQKKPEYGPGVIYARAIRKNDSIQPVILEEGSTLLLDDQAVAWNQEKVRTLFYGNVYGRQSGQLDLNPDSSGN